jgi:hypothetical protein
VLTLPPRHRCPLTWLPASRLLLPRSGLERSDFVLLARLRHADEHQECPLIGVDRKGPADDYVM